MSETLAKTRVPLLRAMNPIWAAIVDGLEWLPRSPEEMEAEAADKCALARCRRHRRCLGATPELRGSRLPVEAGT